MPTDATGKVTAARLSRDAYLYVRQSTMSQVLHNAESTARQYDLRGRAVALGWPAGRVHVIDVDQGRSGASATDREGFQHLVAEVSLGRAGIVLGLECSRLARNSADWHRLLEISALNDTLICDEDGLYDPCAVNDRMLLGMKGQISEFELHTLRQRMQGGLLAKAARGDLAMRLPVGLVYDSAGAVVLDPDAEVRAAVDHLHSAFRAAGSAIAVVKTFRAEGLHFPARHLSGPRAGELYWVPLRHDRVLEVLHNPRYSGAYCYGRKRHRTNAGGVVRTTLKPREEWTVLIPDAHPGYVGFAEFETNQAILTSNATARGEDRRAGPPREGVALLQGLAVCGVCGKRMTVRYHHRRDGSPVPDYVCQREGIATATPPCQTICGSGIDAAVADLVATAVSPLAIEASLAVAEELTQRAAEADRIRAVHVERARHAADAARRRYLAVDPTNRLVADALEADWNGKLRDLAESEEDYRRGQGHNGVLTAEQQTRIRALSTDFPALFHDPATSMRERKRLIRHLINDVTLIKAGEHITAHVRFAGGQTDTINVPRPLRAWETHTTPPETLTIIDELLAEHTHDEAVAILNARGLTGGWRTPFTVASLTALCKAHGIPALRERLRAQGMLTVEETARQLGVSTDTVATWRRQGLLTARRVDGRRSHLYHPGQGRPPLHHKTEAADRRADGLLSANQLAAQLGVSSSTVTRWHRLGLITAVPVEHHGVLYPDGQRRPTPAQIIAAGRPLAYRHQQLITGGQLATRLHVARSTIYKWYRLGLIEAVAADYRGRHLYRPDQQPPDPAEITTARTAASTDTATTRPRKCQTRPARYDQRKRRNPPPTRQTAGTPPRGAV